MCGEAQTKHCNTNTSSWGRFVLTGMICIPSETPSEKLFLLWEQSVGGSFGARMGAYVFFPSQHLGSVWLRLVQTLCRLCCHNFWIYMHQPILLCLESYVSLISSIPTGFYNLPNPSPVCRALWAVRWRIRWDIPFRTGFQGLWLDGEHVFSLWVSTCSLLPQEDALTIAEQGSDLWV